MPKYTKQLTDTELVKKSFNPRLRRMLKILLVIAFAMLMYVIFSGFKNGANPLFVLIGLLVGASHGLIFARMFKLSWDDDNSRVAYRVDIIGLILLVAFIAFDFARTDLVSDVLSGPNVKTVSIALLAGTFYGRVYGIGHNVISILREQKIPPSKKEARVRH